MLKQEKELDTALYFAGLLQRRIRVLAHRSGRLPCVAAMALQRAGTSEAGIESLLLRHRKARTRGTLLSRREGLLLEAALVLPPAGHADRVRGGLEAIAAAVLRQHRHLEAAHLLAGGKVGLRLAFRAGRDEAILAHGNLAGAAMALSGPVGAA